MRGLLLGWRQGTPRDKQRQVARRAARRDNRRVIRRRALPMLALAAPAFAQAPAESRIGAIFPASSLLSDEALRGLELAVEERGRPTRLVRGEAGEAAQVLAEARRLVQAERCTLLFGSGNVTSALAALQAVDSLEVPFVELVATAEALLERPSRWLIRPGPRAADFGAVAAGALMRVLPGWLGQPTEALRIALLHEASPSPTSLAESCEARLREAGLTVLERLTHAPRTAEMPALVQRLRTAGASALLHAGSEADAAALLRALAEAPWRPPVIMGLGSAWGLAELARTAGIEGCFVLDVPPVATAEALAPGARPFAELYQRRWGAAPRGGLSLAAYSGARTVLAAPGERLALRQALGAVDQPEGTLPNGWGWRLDERGQNLRAAPVLSQWQAGRPVAVWPEAAAFGPISPP
ncbi:ABC transporter substrate-binding protein [Sabulicella glaciei]|uniref:ABC transporter substrate-binding protein n=1 Tax=Sabulicella glaciei TaxID=2984948 RepID=A0ABT3NW55_9PROT|nr:ABC transporter substrate-binding protein [Roseococcus sp. MDT2-1-1]MCW8086404.1 ABC transporter substrate-binding protein [Roseococcus sp. MDT2-1-1]